MNKQPSLFSPRSLHWGALEIAVVYLILGSLWILFSDTVASNIAPSEAILSLIGLYKGWGYVIVTAVLLHWLIRRHTVTLQASESRLHRLIGALPALISYVGADRRYQFVNRAYQDWFDGEVLGKHVQEVLGDPAYKIVSKYIDRVLDGETVSYETEIPLPDGERCISAIFVPDMAANGKVQGYFSLVHDVTDQKQVRDEVRLWADAFEGCAHGIAIGDPNSNRITACNPAFATLQKCRAEEIVGSAILSLYPPAEHEHVSRHIQKADQIGHARFEARMSRKDGSTLPVEMDVVSVLGEDGDVQYRVVTAQDISERQEAQERLIESEAKYRTLAEHLPAITYISEPGKYMGVSYISPQIEDLGFDRDTWLADPEFWFRHVHPDDQPHVMAELERFKDGVEPFRSEYRLTLPNGETRWFHDESISVRDQQGKPVLKQGFMMDITERKQAEKKLQLQARLLDQINDAVILSDLNLTITGWNPAAERIYGWKAEEVIGRKGEDVLHSEFSHKTRAEIVGSLKEQGEFSDEITQVRKDGSRIHIETRTVTLRDIHEIAVGYVSVNRDITERKRVEEENKILARFPSENPNPVLRASHDGNILYANAASEPLLQDWHTQVGDSLPAGWVKILQELSQTGARRIIDETFGDKTFSFIMVYAPSANDVNIYGRDITDRQRAEDNLRRFELLSEHSRDVILFMRRDGGRILDTNAAAARMYGYSREELLSLSILDLRATDTQDLTANQMAQADAGGILFETLHRRKDGTVFPVEVSSQGASIGGARTLISIVRDITERKSAEKALTESEARFRSLFEESADAHLLLEDGIFTDCNLAAVQMLRAQNKEEMLSTSPSRLSPEYQPDGRLSSEKADEMMSTAIAQKSHRFEWIHRRMDGTDFPVEVFLTAISTDERQVIHAVWRDITERKQIEQALQAAHNELEQKVRERTAALSEANVLLQALMDNMPDHIYFKDTQSRFIRNSRSQAQLLGLTDPQESVGKTDFDFFPHAAKSYEEEQEVMRSGKPLVDLEEWVVWPDGRETWVTTTKLPLRNSEGQTVGIFGISHDITERKRAEQAIRQLNVDLEKQAEQLQAANKELEAFSYSVSHDLRAPLRAIDGYTRILVEDYESILDEEGKRICGVISREARRMGQLIDDLLSFSRLGRKEMYASKIEMRTLAVSILNELLKEENRDRFDIHIANLPTAQGDSSLIRQVWVNLLSNAIKFTSKKERAVIEIGTKTTKEEFIYFVRDNGAGFEMEYANKLFGVFQRLHSESEFTGTGVGLAIVQRIIRRHGGRVWAEGAVEKGATFYFTLPKKENLS